MTFTGRESIADISRLCRALAARCAEHSPGTDPATDDVVAAIQEEIDALPVPSQSTQFLAAMVHTMRNRLVRVLEPTGRPAITLDEIEERIALEHTANPRLLSACFEILRLMAPGPQNRDESALGLAVGKTGEDWGHDANFTLLHIYLRLARGVAELDPAVNSVSDLLAQVSLNEETSLIAQGEA